MRPQPPTEFSQWLVKQGLERYIAVFNENGIDFDSIGLLTEQELADLGVLLGHRKKLLRALGELGTPNSVAATTATQKVDGPQASPSAVERRQITVMFCDLVGSMELSARVDPEDLRHVVRDYHAVATQIVQRYEGSVAQFLGDGLLVYFGHPSAHEDDPERAVRAGLEIAESVRDAARCAVRIGIHTGIVVVSELGEGSRTERLALGDTPNIASRLQALAASNTVILSEQTRRLAGAGFQYRDLGELRLKGIETPLRCWRVEGLRTTVSRFDATSHGALTPLVGREHEIALLNERWELAQANEGQVVLLSGEPGIGKSRIVNALVERLKSGRIFRLQCSPYGVNTAFHPFIDYLTRTLGFTRDDTDPQKLDKLITSFSGAFALPDSDLRLIAELLSIAGEARFGALNLSPQLIRDETQRVLLEVLESAARACPSLLVIEDIHWADPTTLVVLDQLVDRARSVPLLITMTHRPEFQARWHMHDHVTALNLSKLTRAQSSAIVTQLTTGSALSAEMVTQIIAKTDGVPLFVEELTKAVLESNQTGLGPTPAPHQAVINKLSVPATLRDSLMSRLDRDPTIKEVAQHGAIIGREFDYALLLELSDRTPVELDGALARLTESGLAFRRGSATNPTFMFKHALVQDAAYESLARETRQTLHARAADAIARLTPRARELEPELLAHHLTEAGAREAAINCWHAAGVRAGQRAALNEAVSHLHKGLRLCGELPFTPATALMELELQTALGNVLLGA